MNPRSRYHMRCRDCRKINGDGRFTITFRRRYLGPAVKCRKCRSTNVADIEQIVRRYRDNDIKCYCYGVTFPHRRASHKLCHKYPHPTPLPPELEEELQEAERRMVMKKSRK